MKPIPIYLKFESEAESIPVLFSEIPVAFDENGEPTEYVRQPKYMNLDVIGTYDDGDPENPVPVEGWHVNILLLPHEDEEALEPYKLPDPATPYRVWAL